MKEAAKNMEFETAAALRDEMFELKKQLKSKIADTPIGLIREETAKNLASMK
jgi:excinuclease UvrABC nuclease subunit